MLLLPERRVAAGRPPQSWPKCEAREAQGANFDASDGEQNPPSSWRRDAEAQRRAFAAPRASANPALLCPSRFNTNATV